MHDGTDGTAQGPGAQQANQAPNKPAGIVANGVESQVIARTILAHPNIVEPGAPASAPGLGSEPHHPLPGKRSDHARR